jgi:cupin fold WbuC family metalloprotein
MTEPVSIDVALLDRLSAAARSSPRGRRNHNFHASEADPCNRLLNAIEPGSYVQPHRHLDPAKDETIVVVRGRLGAVLFDEGGRVTHVALLGAASERIGIDVPHGTFHTLLALEPGTVFFEAKAGPYVPIGADERAVWAPAEGSPEAAAYHARLLARLAGERR